MTPAPTEDVRKLERGEISMLCWHCNVGVQVRQSPNDLKKKKHVEESDAVFKRGDCIGMEIWSVGSCQLYKEVLSLQVNGGECGGNWSVETQLSKETTTNNENTEIEIAVAGFI